VGIHSEESEGKMKTIEQYEMEILEKSSVINNQLDIFHENIGQIGHVIGKDATHVYDVILSSFDQATAEYNETTKNVKKLELISAKLDHILNVLAEVMTAINRMENSRDEDAITVKLEVNDLIERANAMLETAIVETSSATGMERGTTSRLVVGFGVYFISRLVGISRLPSIGLGIASAWIFPKQ